MCVVKHVWQFVDCAQERGIIPCHPALCLKEAKNINKSLSALGDVINALGESSGGRSHVPYRNSKLTFMMQKCLSGDGKTLMIANLSPEAESAAESEASGSYAWPRDVATHSRTSAV